MEETKDSEGMRTYVRTLRWGPKSNWGQGRPFMRIREIAQLLRMSPPKVRDLLTGDDTVRHRQPQDRRGAPSKLRPEHIAYLCSGGTLQAWADRTLKERAVLFHRRFGEIKIDYSTILRVYREHGIKRKALRYVKTLKYQAPEKRAEQTRMMLAEVSRAVECGKRLIYVDEAMFTTSTMLDRGYSGKRQNVTLEEKLVSSPALAVVAGVSSERGLEAFHLKPASIDSEAFMQFLLTLLESAKPSEFVIFADNCRVHHSKKVAEFLKANQIEIIFNVPYAPEYNPIERVWSKIKLCFKKARLSAILDGNTPNFEKLLRKILNEFPQEKVRSICHGTYRSKLAQ